MEIFSPRLGFFHSLVRINSFYEKIRAADPMKYLLLKIQYITFMHDSGVSGGIER